MRKLLTLLLLIISTTVGCEPQRSMEQADKPLEAPKPPQGASVLYQMVLEWAVLNEPLPGATSNISFPDRNLVKDEPIIHVSRKNLPKDLKLSLEGREIQILSEERLQKLAEKKGDFPAFQFTVPKISGESAEIGLDLHWFLREKMEADVVPLSGGGVQLRFRQVDENWTFEKLVSRWIQ